VIYRRRSSPLHAVRATVGAAWCLALAGIALSLEHPLLLTALLAAVLLAAALAGVGRDAVRASAWALPFALVIAAINTLVTREGLTVLARAELPWLGAFDLTLEATVYGLVLGLRAVVIIACFALYSAAVDPDQLLRGFRRLGVRSGLTAALATRMVGVLAGDARRLRDAQRSRGGAPAPRVAVARAVAVNALDRAADVAATLEVRGFAGARRAAATVRRPWSRHDAAFAAAAVGLVVAAVVVHVARWESFEAYPRTVADIGARDLGIAVALVSLTLLPFADRRGIHR
jgi:energy-coupling factor transport system permease protein